MNNTNYGRTPRGFQKTNPTGMEDFTQANGVWRGQRVMVRTDDVRATRAWKMVDGKETTRIIYDTETEESVIVFGTRAEVHQKLGLSAPTESESVTSLA
jgi:hypothetical protein